MTKWSSSFLLILLSAQAWAYKTDFRDFHGGISIGGGSQFQHARLDPNWDPLPRMLAAGNTISGSDDFYRVPVRLGYFYRLPRMALEGYFRYVTSLSSSYTVTGSDPGSGELTYRSIGAGVNGSIAFFQANRFKLNLLGNAEYITHKVTVNFTPSGGGSQSVRIHTPAVMAGAGLGMEIYLMDLWSLSLEAIYEYGWERTWTVAQGGAVFGRSFSSGNLQDSSGANIRSSFEGILVEAVFRLSFY